MHRAAWRRWKAFKPTVALVKGCLGSLIPVLMDPVRHLGQMMAVNALACRDGIPVYSWEPSREAEIARLLIVKARE